MQFFDDLKGKRAVITGATGVVGRSIVQTLKAAGCHLCLTDVAQGPLDAMKLSGESFGRAADLTSAASIEELGTEIGKRWGAADILVNNAGVSPKGGLLDLPAAEWDRIFDVNLRAPFILTRRIATQMIQKKVRGSIINISSGASRKMRSTVVPYCTSKTALDRLTKGFAVELAEFGIRVNALEPGFAPGSTVSELTDAHITSTVAAIPMGRQSTPEDVGNGILYLASDASSYVTGATLTIDGGNSIGSTAVHQAKKKPL